MEAIISQIFRFVWSKLRGSLYQNNKFGITAINPDDQYAGGPGYEIDVIAPLLEQAFEQQYTPLLIIKNIEEQFKSYAYNLGYTGFTQDGYKSEMYNAFHEYIKEAIGECSLYDLFIQGDDENSYDIYMQDINWSFVRQKIVTKLQEEQFLDLKGKSIDVAQILPKTAKEFEYWCSLLEPEEQYTQQWLKKDPLNIAEISMLIHYLPSNYSFYGNLKDYVQLDSNYIQFLEYLKENTELLLNDAFMKNFFSVLTTDQIKTLLLSDVKVKGKEERIINYCLGNNKLSVLDSIVFDDENSALDNYIELMSMERMQAIIYFLTNVSRDFKNIDAYYKNITHEDIQQIEQEINANPTILRSYRFVENYMSFIEPKKIGYLLSKIEPSVLDKLVQAKNNTLMENIVEFAASDIDAYLDSIQNISNKHFDLLIDDIFLEQLLPRLSAEQIQILLSTKITIDKNTDSFLNHCITRNKTSVLDAIVLNKDKNFLENYLELVVMDRHEAIVFLINKLPNDDKSIEDVCKSLSDHDVLKVEEMINDNPSILSTYRLIKNYFAILSVDKVGDFLSKIQFEDLKLIFSDKNDKLMSKLVQFASPDINDYWNRFEKRSKFQAKALCELLVYANPETEIKGKLTPKQYKKIEKYIFENPHLLKSDNFNKNMLSIIPDESKKEFLLYGQKMMIKSNDINNDFSE